MGREAENVAEIQVVRVASGPLLRVVVPRGTTVSETFKLGEIISEITHGLNGCLACNSGVPLEFIEREDLSEIVRVDLATMQRI
jgi:hypothetical protein